jgi:hypothetical protein
VDITSASLKKTIGVDRSAFSQFLGPRAKKDCFIAKSCGVSLAWLMGSIAYDGDGGGIVPSLESMCLMGQEAEDASPNGTVIRSVICHMCPAPC